MDNDYGIVGTAGHIDHGKSALVRALTGTDPDRLQEERERGITIDLGFAYLELEGGTRVGFIDVPGKRRRHVIQAVGSRIGCYFDRDWQADEARQSRLVVIGLSPLDRTAISAALGGI